MDIDLQLRLDRVGSRVAVTVVNRSAAPVRLDGVRLELDGRAYDAGAGLEVPAGGAKSAGFDVTPPRPPGSYPLIATIRYRNEGRTLTLRHLGVFDHVRAARLEETCEAPDVEMGAQGEVTLRAGSPGLWRLVVPEELRVRAAGVAGDRATFSVESAAQGLRQRYPYFAVAEGTRDGAHALSSCAGTLNVDTRPGRDEAGAPGPVLGAVTALALFGAALWQARASRSRPGDKRAGAASALRRFLPVLAVLAVGYLTYVRGYSEPRALFWDEGSYIPIAQKYLHGVFVMHDHPPLAKLLMALGQKLVHADRADDRFLGVKDASPLPDGFSPAGYRLFPVLLGWLAAGLLFSCFRSLTGSDEWALALSCLYLFNNATILHFRGAMLDGVQTFFLAAALRCYLALRGEEATPRAGAGAALLLGVCLGAAVATKINGLIFVLLIPAALLDPERRLARLRLLGLSGAGCAVALAGIWHVHFRLGSRVVPSLENAGYFDASPKYRRILAEGRNASLKAFPVMLRDSLRYAHRIQAGIPELNFSKLDEQGSPPTFWPLGGRSISYRWDQSGSTTRYLHLVANPGVWLAGDLGVLFAFAILANALVAGRRRRAAELWLLGVFFALYAAYMAAVAIQDRVLFLYTYFPPLIVSHFLFALVVREARLPGSREAQDGLKRSILWGFAALSAACYAYFLPLTYHLPLTDEQFKARNWLKLWDVRHGDWPSTNPWARPRGDPKLRLNPNIRISGVWAEYGRQDMGEPKQDESFDGPLLVNGTRYRSGLGFHANALYRFRLGGRYRRFEGKVGLPDFIAGKPEDHASVTFEIIADGRQLWSSGVIRQGDPAKSFSVPMDGVEWLDLRNGDAGDGNAKDHACWLEPRLLARAAGERAVGGALRVKGPSTHSP